jgi:hypothetical protein
MRFWSAKGVFNSPWCSQSSPLSEDGRKMMRERKLRNTKVLNFRRLLKNQRKYPN